jgi:DNA-binding PadR family transcriptional regulator
MTPREVLMLDLTQTVALLILGGKEKVLERDVSNTLHEIFGVTDAEVWRALNLKNMEKLCDRHVSDFGPQTGAGLMPPARVFYSLTEKGKEEVLRIVTPIVDLHKKMLERKVSG